MGESHFAGKRPQARVFHDVAVMRVDSRTLRVAVLAGVAIASNDCTDVLGIHQPDDRLAALVDAGAGGDPPGVALDSGAVLDAPSARADATPDGDAQAVTGVEAGWSLDSTAPDGSTDPCKDGVTHTLCDDFDGPTLAVWWQTVGGTPDACSLPTLATDGFVSPPHSLVSATRGQANNCDVVMARLPVGSRIRCEFDLRVDAAPQGYMNFFTLDVAVPGIRQYGVGFALDPGRVILREARFETDGGISDNTAVVPVDATSLAAWTHVSIDVDFTARATCTVGASGAGLTLRYPPPVTNFTDLAVNLGIPYDAALDQASVRHDNLVCDVLP